jgi:hypothetical protein
MTIPFNPQLSSGKSLKRFFLFFLLICSAVYKTSALSVYNFTFQFHGHTTVYEAFAVRNGDGTGFVRVSYYRQGVHQTVNMPFTEKYHHNSYSLVFVTTRPQGVYGTLAYTPDAFIFKKSQNGDYYEPIAVEDWLGGDGSVSMDLWDDIPLWSTEYAADGHLDDSLMMTTTIANFKVLELNTLSESFVLKFFRSDETFYKNLFGTQYNSNYNFYQQQKPTLHLLLVANITDRNIRDACNKDERNIYDYFKEIAKIIGATFDPHVIDGQNFGKDNVMAMIDKLYPAKNDIVVFYYSGHGFRFSNSTSNYPYLDLRSGKADNLRDASLGAWDIYTSIIKKGAKLNVVLYDCCNADVGIPKSISTGYAITQKSINSLSPYNCKRLFLQTQKNIIASASAPNQVASCESGMGGYFTYFLCEALDNALSAFSTPSWENIISTAINATSNFVKKGDCKVPPCKQDPIYYTE